MKKFVLGLLLLSLAPGAAQSHLQSRVILQGAFWMSGKGGKQ